MECVGRRPPSDTSIANVWFAAPVLGAEVREAAFAATQGTQMREDEFRGLAQSVWKRATKRDLGLR
jgi:hypothetical protein